MGLSYNTKLRYDKATVTQAAKRLKEEGLWLKHPFFNEINLLVEDWVCGKRSIFWLIKSCNGGYFTSGV